MTKKTILITGGLGYIGSHGVIDFEQAGYKTIIVDNLSNSSKEVMNDIETILGYRPDYFELDLRDKEQLEIIFDKYDIDGVIHFAGLKAVGESVEKSMKYFNNNVNGSIKLFEAMDDHDVRNIIFSSSATVYSENNSLPLKEDGELGTSNPYGTSKLIIEKLLEDLAKFSGFKVMNLRYFNPIGAHPSGLLGEKPDGIPNNLLPHIMKVATGELETLKVFGNDYDTIDGTGVRDYIDINDLVDGHLLAYEKLEKHTEAQGFFESYNLGVGKGYSVLEVLKATEEVIGKKIPYTIEPRRKGDLAEIYCDTNKAENELGFKAETSLRESLENSWKFANKK